MVKDIPVIGHSETIRSDNHLNKNGLHLNKSETIAFAENISRYLLELNRLSPDNSRNEILESQQTSYKTANTAQKI